MLKNYYLYPTNQIIRSSLRIVNSSLSEKYFAYRPKQKKIKNWKILSGDMVEVIQGTDKGKTGRVLKVDRKKNQVVVQGANYVFKKVKQEEGFTRTKTAQKQSPIHVSNVALIDPETKKPTRVSFGYIQTGEKVRISSKTGSIIQKPKRDSMRYYVRNSNRLEVNQKDTAPQTVLQRTYKGQDFSQIKKQFEEYIREKEARQKLLVFSS